MPSSASAVARRVDGVDEKVDLQLVIRAGLRVDTELANAGLNEYVLA